MGKVDQQECLNEYERARIAKITQNKVRLEELGVQNLVQSSTSLVESSKSKRRKHNKSKRTNHSDKENLDYFPSNNEVENDHEIAEFHKKVPKSGSRQRAQYIPPGSVTRYSNYTRLRNQGQANKHQQWFELQQLFDKDQTRERQDDASNVNPSQKNGVRKMTMADLILKRNQLQREKETSTDFDQPSHFSPTEGDNMGDHYENSSQFERDQLIAACFGGDALTDSSSEGETSDTSHSSEEDPEDESEEINLDSRDLDVGACVLHS